MAEEVPVIVAREPTRRWSVMVPTYNCSRWLASTLDSVLAQDPGSDTMQIVVVDDCSTDDPESVVRAYGNRVEFVQHEANRGAIRNFNSCLDLADGELVHLLHGDDLVRPGFYEQLNGALVDASIDAAATRVELIDDANRIRKTTRSEQADSGIWDAALDRLAVSNRIFAPGFVARRQTYERLGGFRPDLPHAADWEMWARIASNGRVWFHNEALAAYRVHDGQDTGTRMMNGQNIIERRHAIELVLSHVQPTERLVRRRQALGYSAIYGIRTSAALARSGHLRGAARQLVEAGRCVLAATGSSGR